MPLSDPSFPSGHGVQSRGAVLVAAGRGAPLRARAVCGAGAALLGATTAGLLAGFVAEPGLAGLPLPVVFAVVFPPIVGGVVLLYTVGVVLATHPLPGWRVGTGDGAMIKVGWLGTLLGGAVAGARPGRSPWNRHDRHRPCL